MASSTRRGKTATDTTASKNGTAPGTNGVVTDQLVAQLERATAQLQQSRTNMQALHQMWETYLAVISYIVLALSVHQVVTVTRHCRDDIAFVNSNVAVATSDAALSVVRDAAVPLLGLFMAGLLALFLRVVQTNQSIQRDMLSHPLFLTAQACIIPIFVLLHRSTTASAVTSCLAPHVVSSSMSNALPSVTNPLPTRQWPSVLVLDAVVTISVWMMQRQRAYLQQSAVAVYELRDELAAGQAPTTSSAPTNPQQKKQQ